MRASSSLFDPESNEDAISIAPGKTATLAKLYNLISMRRNCSFGSVSEWTNSSRRT